MEQQSNKPTTQTSDRKRVLVLGVMLIAGTIWVVLGEPTSTQIQTTTNIKPPVLFESEPECGVIKGVALKRAMDAQALAFSKSERYPFDARDGIEAVQHYQIARACFLTEGDTRRALENEREARAMQKRVQEDYKTYQVTLRRALEQKHFKDALYSTKMLSQLCEQHGGPYLAWLKRLAWDLQKKLDETAKKRA